MLLFKSPKTLWLFSSVILLLFLCQTASAINRRRSVRVERSVTQEYMPQWSFQMALDESFDDDDDVLTGLRLSLLHRHSKFTAVRFNLGIVGREQYDPDRRVYVIDDMAFEFDDRTNFDFTGVNLSLQYLFYPSPNRQVNFFWGLGPMLTASEADPGIDFIIYHDFPYQWVEYADWQDVTLVGVGVDATMGMEWFLGRNFSLLAEYGITVQKQWYLLDVDYYDYDGYRVNEVEAVDNGTHVDATRVKLGVAFHF
jgi:hypothetical protein